MEDRLKQWKPATPPPELRERTLEAVRGELALARSGQSYALYVLAATAAAAAVLVVWLMNAGSSKDKPQSFVAEDERLEPKTPQRAEVLREFRGAIDRYDDNSNDLEIAECFVLRTAEEAAQFVGTFHPQNYSLPHSDRSETFADVDFKRHMVVGHTLPYGMSGRLFFFKQNARQWQTVLMESDYAAGPDVSEPLANWDGEIVPCLFAVVERSQAELAVEIVSVRYYFNPDASVARLADAQTPLRIVRSEREWTDLWNQSKPALAPCSFTDWQVAFVCLPNEWDREREVYTGYDVTTEVYDCGRTVELCWQARGESAAGAVLVETEEQAEKLWVSFGEDPVHIPPQHRMYCMLPRDIKQVRLAVIDEQGKKRVYRPGDRALGASAGHFVADDEAMPQPPQSVKLTDEFNGSITIGGEGDVPAPVLFHSAEAAAEFVERYRPENWSQHKAVPETFAEVDFAREMVLYHPLNYDATGHACFFRHSDDAWSAVVLERLEVWGPDMPKIMKKRDASKIPCLFAVVEASKSKVNISLIALRSYFNPDTVVGSLRDAEIPLRLIDSSAAWSTLWNGDGIPGEPGDFDEYRLAFVCLPNGWDREKEVYTRYVDTVEACDGGQVLELIVKARAEPAGEEAVLVETEVQAVELRMCSGSGSPVRGIPPQHRLFYLLPRSVKEVQLVVVDEDGGQRRYKDGEALKK